MNNKKKEFFGTDGIRGRVGTFPISADWILKLGWAFGSVISTKKRGKVLIGKDTRISGYMFESALEAGLASAGIDTYLLGPIPTPGIAYLTRTLQADAGIVISASHNPYYDNGIKFFSSKGLKLSDKVELIIEEQLSKPMVTVESSRIGKAIRLNDAAGRYIEFCKSTFPQEYSLEGLKIVVDCANGAAYHIAPSVLNELGAEVIAIGVSPDGLNINKNCGSTSPLLLSKEVIKQKAHLGIALDGDGDRVIFVDHTGSVVDGDELLFIIAKWYKDSGKLSGGVAGTLMSNLGLEKKFLEMDIPFCRTKVGDRYVLEALKEKDWNLGGESSGHILCLDSHTTGDGIISSLKVLAAICAYGCSLQDLKNQMVKYPQVLHNIPINSKQDLNNNEAIKKAVINAEKKLKQDGRVLLRTSGTEPLMRVMVEGRNVSIVDQVASDLVSVISEELASTISV
jgi:phosphoglucosamine mutase